MVSVYLVRSTVFTSRERETLRVEREEEEGVEKGGG